MKICLACSPGGHLTELRELMEAFSGYDPFYVTIRTRSTEDLDPSYYVPDSYGATGLHMLLNMVRITIQSARILLRERPDAILSTGADVTIPLCYLGKLMGSKVIFIESVCRVDDLSPTGKILYPISDLFLVQWETLARKYRKAQYWGGLL